MSTSHVSDRGGGKLSVQWYPYATLRLLPIRLEIEAEGGLVLASATGFFVRDAGARLITARHCVTGVHQETGQILGGYPVALRVHLRPIDGGSANVVGRIPLFDEEGRPLWSEHPELGASADIVAIPVGALVRRDVETPAMVPPGMRGDMLLLEASPIVGFLPRGVVDLAQLAEDDRVVVVGFRDGGGDDRRSGETVAGLSSLRGIPTVLDSRGSSAPEILAPGYLVALFSSFLEVGGTGHSPVCTAVEHHLDSRSSWIAMQLPKRRWSGCSQPVPRLPRSMSPTLI